MMNKREPNRKKARWIRMFAEYDFEVNYLPRPRNANADYLSRSSAEVDMVLSMEYELVLRSVVE